MFEDKAKAAERRAINALNEETSWVQRHPGLMSVISLVLFVGLMVAVVKGCHTTDGISAAESLTSDIDSPVKR